MSFASVFKALQELFPQVDSRILKAVSIEHHKDINAAVEFIINEVVPSTCNPLSQAYILIDDNDERHLPACNPRALLSDNQDVEGSSSCPILVEGQGQLSEFHWSSQEENTCHLESNIVASEPGDDSDCMREVFESSTCLIEEPTCLSQLSSLEVTCKSKLHVEVKTDELNEKDYILNVDSRSITGSPAVLRSTEHGNVEFYDCDSVDDATVPDLDEPESYETNISVCSDSRLTANTNETEKVGGLNLSCISEDSQEPLQESADDSLRANIIPEARGSPGNDSEQTKPADPRGESSSVTVVTQSGTTCSTDVLEDAINEAKTNKKMLFSSMESVIHMIKRAEELETAADEAKKEAVKGGVDVLAKVEELRKMLLHAKEANDMHTGEVYGERAVLGTEARELQARLMNLFYEKNRSLAILDEMHQVLEARLAVAEEIMKAAEQDKLSKEKFARTALLEQESYMENVVLESKRLQREAEVNSKLREFLMDRGQVVDVLQGEMAVICMDIKCLKENFDERAPLSKSLSSGQTSFLLALSGSSGKLSPNLAPEQVESLENPKMISNTPATSELSEVSEKRTCAGSEEHKKLSDDDWALPKMSSTLPVVDNLSERSTSTSEWSEDRMNSMIDDWDLPKTMSTVHYDNLENSTSEGLDIGKNHLDDGWALL